MKGKQRGWVQGWVRQSCSEWQETEQTSAWSSLALDKKKTAVNVKYKTIKLSLNL